LSLLPNRSEALVARIWIDVPLRRTFDYRLDLSNQAHRSLKRGQLITVPFGAGSTPRVGVVASLASESEFPLGKLKPIIDVHQQVPALDERVLQLAEFASGYYKSSTGEAIFAALPPALKQLPMLLPKQRCELVLQTSDLEQIPKRAKAQRELFVQLLALIGKERAIDEDSFFSGLDDDARDRTRRALAALIDSNHIARSVIDPSSLQRRPYSPNSSGWPQLTSEQATSIDAINADTGVPWLLHGVTGSGKTEVYMRLIAQALERGEQALMLVPEINLTPQLEQRVRQRFAGQRVVTLHSSVAQGSRADGWIAAAQGQADIVIGTRLAVFCPLPKLGLIIVDEEHDPSYKQQEGMRYSARDLAVARSQARSQTGSVPITILLGSATPSLESINAVRRGRMQLSQLKERATSGSSVPTVKLVDTRSERLQHGLSKALIVAIEERLKRGEQSLIFINRRGFAPVLYCRNCSSLSHCTRCSARMVWHRHGQRLTCHHCGLTTPVPTNCEACGSADLAAVGQGTQRLEEALAERFPTARMARVDRDSTSRKGSFEAVAKQIHARELDILIGTQMLAKGHDYHGITLVGIVDADTALYSADMRAPERLFATLMQVGGRAGRGALPGEVLVQTNFPKHPLYEALIAHDFSAFAKSELAERERHLLPPYSFMALLRCEADAMQTALRFLDDAAVSVRDLPAVVDQTVDVFDPIPASLQRKEDRWRAQLMLKSPSRSALQQVLDVLTDWLEANDKRVRSERLRVVLDVDPSEV
jgi:primosomal protein N' (replication factor Y) (superfamily II helicase)